MDWKNIETTTIEELFSSSTDGSIPILLDVQSDEIVWDDNDTEQEYGHLRLINCPTPVRYNGHKYLPAYFAASLPEEDGQKVGNASLTISAIDQRIIQIIRSITTQPKCVIESLFAKMNDDTFVFRKLNKYEFVMDSVSWDDVSAKWELIFDPVAQINVPRDKGSSIRCPAIYENGNS